MKLITKALDMPCRVCSEDAGRPCMAIVDGCVMDAGRFHRQRVDDAARATREANRSARARRAAVG